VTEERGREKTRCKARAKRTGEQCKRYCSPGKHVCYIHGGAPGSGGVPGNSGPFKHGLRTTRAGEILREKMPDMAAVADKLFRGFKEMAGWPDGDPREHRLAGVCVKMVLEDLALSTVIAEGLSRSPQGDGEGVMEHYLLKAISRLSSDIRQTLKELDVYTGKTDDPLARLVALWQEDAQPHGRHTDGDV